MPGTKVNAAHKDETIGMKMSFDLSVRNYVLRNGSAA